MPSLIHGSIILRLSVSLVAFDGNISQQWFVYGDGDGQVAIMSRHNKSWLGISSRKTRSPCQLFLAGSVRRSILGGTSQLLIPLTDTALSFEDTVEVRSKSAAKRLYILECTPANEAAIKEGRFPWTAEQKNQPAKAVQEKSPLPPPCNLDISDHPSVGNNAKAVQESALPSPGNLDGSDHPSISRTPLVVPNKPRRGVSVFGTSKPKKIIYGYNSQGLILPTSSPGATDIIGFGDAGVTIWLKNRQENRLVSSHFGYDKGWRNDKHVRLLADTTGRGKADIVGFYDDGVWIAINKGDNTFYEPKIVSSDFSHDKDGVNIVGFGRVLVSLNNGDGTFGPMEVAMSPFLEYRGIPESVARFLADTTGNGRFDIIGIPEISAIIALNKGDADYGRGGTDVNYYSHDEHLRFIADLTGDGLPDIIGIKKMECMQHSTRAWYIWATVKVIANEFCHARGWRVNRHPCFMVDITGNGCADILGFFNDGVYAAINKGNGTFHKVKQVSKHFGYESEDWRMDEHRHGCADIVGIGDNGARQFWALHLVTSCFSTSQPEWMADKSLVYVANLSV
ncbi:hypothetical protein CPB84DRAFT_1795830 [Gymnopilus junonius]|uniref:Uncharacterized protein n=1 Tax=Gymnopilus junonius TaxID=109634 RepID=A0A9P5THP8_GYMJU|nr:hypothetical protein CPB84DRAFT_1795830 [Gymnopilus junonius]